MNKQFKKKFKQSSTTYYFSSLFFPKSIRQDITILYAYVRTADNFVDKKPQDKKGFLEFKKQTKKALNGKKTKSKVINSFAKLAKEKQFKNDWILSFVNSMEQDLKKKEYETYKELENYMYGSAEVIGLMIAKILKLSSKSYPYAKQLGKAMQLINFIRDIQEDKELGRTYLPKEEFKRNSVKYLPPRTKREEEAFKKIIQSNIKKYRLIQKNAEKGYKYMNKKERIAIKTAADNYIWTAKKIENNPMIIFRKKVKPSKLRVLIKGIQNTLNS